MPVVIVQLVLEGLRLVNNILEGIPVEQRRAEAVKWFWLTWPFSKPILKLAGMPTDSLDAMEAAMKEVKV